MSVLPLEESEAKLLVVIEKLNDEDLLYPENEVIDYHSLEDCLRTTSNVKILEAFANNFIYNDDTADRHLAEAIADNRNSPEKLLHKFSQEGGPLGVAVARNTATSDITLLGIYEFSTDEDMVNYAASQLKARKVI